MRFLLDQGVARTVANLLSQAGHEARHVADFGMARASDRDILLEAQRRGEAVITMDADFHAIVAVEGWQQPSVVRIRIESLNATQVCTIVLTVITLHEDALERGAVVSVDQSGSRCRTLPIRR